MRIAMKLMACVLAAWLTPAAASAAKVAVLLSRDLPAFREFVTGVESGADFSVKTYDMSGDAQKGAQVLGEIKAQGYGLLLAVGPEAANLAKNTGGIPYFYSMVVDNLEIENTGGVLMLVDFNDQMAWIRKLIPEARQVSVLYNPAGSAKAIKRARAAAEANQMTLMPIAVENTSEIPNALQRVKDLKSDVLWSVVDSTVGQPGATRTVIDFTTAQRIPFFGLSEYQVKAGALASISVRFRDLGVQSAEMAAQLLAGNGVGKVEPPRRQVIYVNLATQKALGLTSWSKFPEVTQTE